MSAAATLTPPLIEAKRILDREARRLLAEREAKRAENGNGGNR
jgi:hypothetical protein